MSGSRCQEGRDPLARNAPSFVPLTRTVQKVSSHFEYLHNRSSGLDVTWQPVGGDLTVHPWTVNSPVGLVSRQWDAVDWACVLCDRRIHNDRASRSANLHQCACPFYSSRASFMAKHCITQVCPHPYGPDLAPCDFWFFPKLKSPYKVRFMNATVTQYTSSVNGVSLPTD